MAGVLDPSKPFSAELQVIRRLKSSLERNGGRDAWELVHATSPLSTFYHCAEHVALAPIRNDVPLLDPCCGQLSVGAQANLGVKGQRKFKDLHHVASALWVPPGFREKPQTVASSSSVDLREDKAWNSRRIPDAVLKARLSGSTNPVKVQPQSLRTSTKATLHNSSFPDKHTGPKDGFSPDLRPWTDNSAAVQRYRYTSATQRSYEKVGWDTKLPRCLKAPETTLEKMADPVSEHPSSRRYNSRPQLWQSIGAEWNRQQLRLRNDPKKPISFGTIGSEDMDKLDNKDEDFCPLTLKRSIVPPYMPTARWDTPSSHIRTFIMDL
ncbi:Spermatogenesis-associated protein 48 Post-meiotic spermatogenesis protein 1 [Channa argus]|uniref:Spermatogenesis-associated protein 48 Post-meiotic spermatogenesis protein 1 n=1 Tax=Channa argus TaxID=215402 RepID=A0A6G1R0K6_CHAAH|nr:Spermatogenesis-associated protein 48 Post-meiotic spermatogenesis protein 1 [Channa argus]